MFFSCLVHSAVQYPPSLFDWSVGHYHAGPEVMSKYVGQSEENIRALFADAEAEFKTRGDDSDLHIIIFDEIDAVCTARGSTNSGTGRGLHSPTSQLNLSRFFRGAVLCSVCDEL